MRTWALLASAIVSLGAREALAAQACSALKALDATGNPSTTNAPAVIYVTGSGALKPIIAALAPSMFLAATRPTTVVYVSQGSCTGVSAIVAGAQLAANTTASY